MYENGQKRGGSDEKSTETLDSSFGCKRRRQSSGVMHPMEKKNESEKETNSCSFSGPPIFPKTGVISVFITEKGERVIAEA